MVIAAGYPGEMKAFIDSNPGLASRFNEVWDINDFSEEELLRVLDGFTQQAAVSYTEDFADAFRAQAQMAKRGKNFANARWVRNLIETAIRRHALREPHTAGEPVTLTAADLLVETKVTAPTGRSLDSVTQQLDSLLGLDEVKREVRDLIATQSLRVRRKAAGLPDIDDFVGHLVFSGPPGPGKTTVARFIGQIYRELGVLSSGHCVETQRSDLVAGFVGQTATLTETVFRRALGGVLFIDEAYTLAKPSTASGTAHFGQEAIDTLLKLMEDHRRDVVVIAAGYTQSMRHFLASNPGLSSRFTKVLEFAPWGADLLQQGIQQEMASLHLHLAPGADSDLADGCLRLASTPNFASGRTARTFVHQVFASQARRLSADPEGDLQIVTASDLREAIEQSVRSSADHQ